MKTLHLLLVTGIFIVSCTTVPEVPREAPVEPPDTEITDVAPVDIPEEKIREEDGAEQDIPEEPPPEELPPEKAEPEETVPESSVHRWNPPERTPASHVPSALQRRRIAAFAEDLRISAEDLYQPLTPDRYDLVTAVIGVGMGYSWRVIITSTSQLSALNYYGRSEVTVELYDDRNQVSLWKSQWPGRWTFSRISVFDAVDNSLYQLVDERGTEIVAAAHRGAVRAFQEGFPYSIAFASSIDREDRVICLDQLRSLAFSVSEDEAGVRVLSFSPPSRFVDEMRELFSGSPFGIEGNPMNRNVRIVDNYK